MTRARMLPRGTWVVHTRAEDWSAMELGTVRTLSSGIRGAAYHHIPQELPGILLGPLASRRRRAAVEPGSFEASWENNPLVRVLWMGRIFLCGLDDIMRYT